MFLVERQQLSIFNSTKTEDSKKAVRRHILAHRFTLLSCFGYQTKHANQRYV